MTKKQQVKIDGRDLILTNTETVYFPRNGFTNGEVIKFYSEIADTILPSPEKQNTSFRHLDSWAGLPAVAPASAGRR